MTTLIVGIGDCKVSRDRGDVLIAHALGSCIAVMVHDPVAKVGGLLHYLLPESTLSAPRALNRPYLFADTGVPLLLQQVSALGAKRVRMTVTAVGGAQMLDLQDKFNIGKRNEAALRAACQKAGLKVDREVIGGNHPRTVWLDVMSGRVRIRTADGAKAQYWIEHKRNHN